MLLFTVNSKCVHCRRATYQNLGTWLADARRHLTNPNTIIMLVGNKSDLPADQREVTYEEAAKFSEENGYLFELDLCFHH